MTPAEAVLQTDSGPSGWSYLNSLPDVVLVVTRDHRIVYANAAAEQFFEASAATIKRRKLGDFFAADSPAFILFAQAFKSGAVVSEHDVTLHMPRLGPKVVTLQATPVQDYPDEVIVAIREQSIALALDRQLTHRGAARSVTAMASVLAHEVKNPLSGIRGAAQLIEPSLDSENRGLTQLICDEADRICALVDQMEVFSDQRPIERAPVNIHEVLQHVRKVAMAGFAKEVPIAEDYDPSLPPVFGNRDQLVQVFLNLVKNAYEAIDKADGEIRLTTAYKPGMRLAVSPREDRVHLPLVVSVQDNGPGIPDELRRHLFDPFVTTKSGGTGLGLALVAKIINDHGGAIEFNNERRKTRFNVLLPMHHPKEV